MKEALTRGLAKFKIISLLLCSRAYTAYNQYSEKWPYLEASYKQGEARKWDEIRSFKIQAPGADTVYVGGLVYYTSTDDVGRETTRRRPLGGDH